MTLHERGTLEVPLVQEQQKFDYAALDNETRTTVQQHADEIKTLMRRSAQDISNIGQKLVEVKEKLGYGYFTKWLQSEFEWSVSTANRYMQVSEQFTSVNLTEVDIAASALYLLAAPSIPEVVRAEAIKRARKGDTITCAQVKALKQQYKDSALTKSKKIKPVTVEDPVSTEQESSPAISSKSIEAEITEVQLQQKKQTPMVVRKYVEQVGLVTFNQLIVDSLYKDEAAILCNTCFDSMDEAAFSRLDVEKIKFSGLSDSALWFLQEKLQREVTQRHQVAS